MIYRDNIKLISMLAKNQISRNKMDNKSKSDNKNLVFMPFRQNDINVHI